MNVPIEPRHIDQELELTKPRLKALEAFADGEAKAPYDRGVRKDVGRALWEGGWIMLAKGHRYFTGYAPCVITEKGRKALVSVTRVTS
jgi:hypothetical protein